MKRNGFFALFWGKIGGKNFPPIPALAVVFGFLLSYCQEQVTQENAMAKS